MADPDGSIQWSYRDEKRKLVDRLTGSPDQLEVISIVSNKTVSYLARQVYKDPYILSHFQIRTLTYFSLTKSLLAAILCSIAGYKITYESFGNSDKQLGQQLNRVLMGHRFLIFIDKSWCTTSDWDDLKRYFPDNGNGSRIVFFSFSNPHWFGFGFGFGFDVSVRLSRKPFETCDGVQLYFLRAQEEEIISDDSVKEEMMVGAQEEEIISDASVKEEMMVGYGDEVRKLVDRLTGLQKRLEVIPIVGMPGLGKTTLAGQVYNDPSVIYHFDIRAWTRVSQVYQRRDLLLGILISIVELTDEICKMSDQKLLELLKKRLLGHRYLIVMDDMWDNRVWNDLQRSFPDNNNGSKIIFTSRLAEVASHVQGNNVHYLRFLTRDESWELLCQKVFHRRHCPRYLMEIGMQITEKCKGLPLAIIVIAGILANEETPTWWGQVAKSVSSYIVSNPEQYMDTLALSYNHLPPHLKPCFLYLGAFLEDREIPVRKLILLWVSEGFIRNSGSERLEDVAEDYLMDLINRSLVIVSKKGSTGRIKSCIMHDLLRELCLRKFKEENFMQQLYKYDENSTPTSPTTKMPGRVSIYSAPSPSSSLMPFSSNATSLLCFTVEVLPDFVSFICQAFKFLRVLDLSSTKIPHFPSEIIQLVELRYIAIQADVGTPPSSISGLCYLETLIVSSRSSVTLPSNTWKMVNLRHLCIKLGVNEVEKPSFEEVQGNDILENLQTLSFVCPSRYCEDVLKRSPRLRKLGFCGPLLSESRDLRFPMLYADRLETLKLFNTAYYCEASSSCNSYMFPERLKRLTLTNTALAWNEMWTLGMLPNLEVLKLKLHACVGRLWVTSDNGFLRLKFLKFQDLDIVQWIASSNHFPRLEHLVLHGCQKLEEIPLSLGDIPTLEMIEVRWCSETAAHSAHYIKEDQENKGNDCVKYYTTETVCFLDIKLKGSVADDLLFNVDMIRSSSSFYSTMVVHGILNDDPHMLNYKDRAWKFKRNFIEFHMFDSRSLNDDHVFHGIPKDWAWKFKRVERQGGPLE
ncbi:hypothetical protein LguiA_021646 [Lonicera macranthoides]